MDEGYIRFSLDWTKADLDEDITALNAWRTRLFKLGLIGAYNEGTGFGNISKRIAGTDRFIISGTATGEIPLLDKRHYTIVTSFDFKKNSVSCIGPIKASSESMTHAAIYSSRDDVYSVIHVHSKVLWECLKGKVPATSDSAGYGTPEMAKEVIRLLKGFRAGEGGLFIMLGHDEGIVSFGREIGQAGKILLNTLRHIKS